MRPLLANPKRQFVSGHVVEGHVEVLIVRREPRLKDGAR